MFAKFQKKGNSSIKVLSAIDSAFLHNVLHGTRTIEQNGLLMQIILDCTSYKINQLIPYSNQDLVQIERATQHYCFVLLHALSEYSNSSIVKTN
jgi:hypothetical protein